MSSRELRSQAAVAAVSRAPRASVYAAHGCFVPAFEDQVSTSGEVVRALDLGTCDGVGQQKGLPQGGVQSLHGASRLDLGWLLFKQTRERAQQLEEHVLNG